MNTTRRRHLVTAICICMAASSALAHHSHPYFYDQCKSVTIEGRIASIQWKNPHIWIDLTLDDGTTYHVEWTSVQGLANHSVAGPAQDALRFGTRVVVTGNPVREAARIHVSTLYPALKDDPAPKILDPLQIRRADNSWSWAQSDPAVCVRQ
jgi:hypothetical protein